MVRRGFSVLEILISLGLIAIFALSIGTAIASARRLAVVSIHRAQALNVAQAALEQVTALQDDAFACRPIVSNNCTRADGQSCTPRAGALHCWTEKPDGAPADMNDLHIDPATNKLIAGSDTPVTGYTRSIKIENIGSNDTKKITVTVTWENDGPKSATLSTILTDWTRL